MRTLLGLCAAAALACGSDPGPNGAAPDPEPGGAAGDGPVLGGPDPGEQPAAGEPVPRRPLPGAALFVTDQVLRIELTLSAADQLALEEHGDDEVYVPARASISGRGIGPVELPQIGVRHKGAYSLHHCWENPEGVRSREGTCAKLSYKLDFAEYESEARLDGLKKLNLHASSGDATRLRELVAYDTFRDFGVDAPRTAVASVTVNGVLEGLFIVVEAIDGRYTKAHFPAGGDGNLYKEIWPSPVLDTTALREALETNEARGDVSAFQAFAAAVAATTPESFSGAMADWVDLEHTLRYIAVDRALKNWDGIMAFYAPSTPHNFYWYHDTGGSERFQLIPWDLDNTFWEFDPYMAPEQWVSAPPIPDWNQEPRNCNPRPIWQVPSELGVTPPRCDRFLDRLAVTHFERFQAVTAELLDGPFAYARLLERARRHAALIEPIVAEDPHLDLTSWRAERLRFEQTLQAAVSDFEDWVARGLGVEADPDDPGAPLTDRGLDAGRLNDFEFAAPSPGSTPAGVYFYGSTGSTQAAVLNDVTPLSGAYDLRFDFSFTRQPGAWNEWVNFGYSTVNGQPVDLSVAESILLTLRADRPRTLRVRLNSPAYDDSFGGAWSEFGVDLQVTTSATTFELPLSEFVYAEWAREAWTTGQGWTTPDADALALVRQRFSGLVFAPSASTDEAGELSAETEAGFLQIDEIRVQP